MKKLVSLLLVYSISLIANEVYTTVSVEAKHNAELAFDASGTVEKVYVGVSSHVKRGDALAKLKNDDIKAALDMATAEYENAKASLKYALRDFQRQEKVKDMIDEAEFDRYALMYEKAKAEEQKSAANLLYQKALYEKTILRAPFSGVISWKDIDVGDVVSGMMLKTVFHIQNLYERKLILEFDQRYWNNVAVGDKIIYTLDGSKKSYSAKISKIYPSIDTKSRMMKAEAKASKLPVGLFGTGHIYTRHK
jgi:RND family efflux transporter MFP subunit